MSGCGFEFITKAEPCGRNFWDCLTQSKPVFSWIGNIETLKALQPTAHRKACHYQVPANFDFIDCFK